MPPGIIVLGQIDTGRDRVRQGGHNRYVEGVADADIWTPPRPDDAIETKQEWRDVLSEYRMCLTTMKHVSLLSRFRHRSLAKVAWACIDEYPTRRCDNCFTKPKEMVLKRPHHFIRKALS